jgi:hypothetical protein
MGIFSSAARLKLTRDADQVAIDNLTMGTSIAWFSNNYALDSLESVPVSFSVALTLPISGQALITLFSSVASGRVGLLSESNADQAFSG